MRVLRLRQLNDIRAAANRLHVATSHERCACHLSRRPGDFPGVPAPPESPQCRKSLHWPESATDALGERAVRYVKLATPVVFWAAAGRSALGELKAPVMSITKRSSRILDLPAIGEMLPGPNSELWKLLDGTCRYT